MNFKPSQFFLVIILVQILHINCQSFHGGKHNNNNNNNRQSDLTAGGRSVGRRRQQQHVHKQRSNKTGWAVRRRNNHHSNNNNPNQNISNDPVSVNNNSEKIENPPFPPGSDSFWRGEQQTRGQNSKRHGKKKQHEDTQQSKMPKVDAGAERSEAKESKADRPNIILIITDDQDVELGSMNYMPDTLKEFQENGVEFRHGYVTTPMCCPSRSSMLTGLYVHNHQVFTNNDNCSSIQWRQKYEKKTFAYHLHEAGYYTSYVGKYLNKYDGSHIPQGWDEWNGLLMNSRFYNYTVNRNGKKYRFGNTYEYDYYPDVVTNDTLDFLDRVGGMEPTPSSEPVTDPDGEHNQEMFSSGSGGESEEVEGSKTKSKSKKLSPKSPFLLVISYPSPHGPEDSAPQYSQMFFNSTPHHTPSYDYAPNLDKQWILRVTDKMTPQLRTFTDLLMTKRLQTLQSVDDAIKKIFDKLRETRLIESSYIFYTSDHGYHVGQFGLIKGKSMPYEFDVRVPFYLRVPTGLPEEYSQSHPSRGIRINEPVLNIDLAPTFLDLGGVEVPSWMDGRSLLPLINHYIDPRDNNSHLDWGHTFLIESSGRREPAPSNLTSVRLKRRKSNRTPPRLDTAIDEEDEEGILQGVCQMHPYPCQPRQKKYCKVDMRRIRFRKCRTGIDYEIFGTGNNITKCSCRSRRSSPQVPSERWDWDEERVKIDEEIDELKLKMKNLREKKRRMRVQWLMARNENRGHHDQFLRRKFNLEQHENVGNETLNVSNPGTTAKSDDASFYGIGIRPEGSHKGLLQPGGIEDTDEDEDVDEEDQDETALVFHHSDEDQDEGEHIDSISVVDDMFPVGRRKHKGQRNKGRHKKKPKDRDRVSNGPGGIVVDGDEEGACDCEQHLDPRLLRQMERDDRKRRKLMSKIRKKQRFLNRIGDPTERLQAETCGTEEKMNCFWHDSDHWRTPPLWKDGSFCFCMNSNNNTFTCLRSVNSTHNYLYCQFITGFKMYFNLREDPHELRNLIGSLPAAAEDWMLGELLRLKSCQGQKQCWPQSTTRRNRNDDFVRLEPSVWEQIFGRWKGKRKNRNGRRKQL